MAGRLGRLGPAMAVAALLAQAAPASAETVTLSAASPKHEWTSTGTAVGTVPIAACAPIRPCEDKLVHLQDGGDLVVGIEGQGSPSQDIDLFVYASDANGRKGKELGASWDCYSDERVRVHDAKPGYFLVRVLHWNAANESYAGKAWLVGAEDAGPEVPHEPIRVRGTLSAANSTMAWTAEPMSGVYWCWGGHTQSLDYQAVHLRVLTAGKLTLEIQGTSMGARDLNLYFTRSDASGYRGRELGTGYQPGATEKITRSVQPGWYSLSQYVIEGVNATWDGTATLEPAPPADPVSVPVVAPMNLKPTVRPVKPDPRRRLLRALKGTAADDGAVARVEVTVVRKSGRRCRALTPRGMLGPSRKCTVATKPVRALGAIAWVVPLRKTLPRGRYQLVARAFDTSGLAGDPVSLKFTLR